MLFGVVLGRGGGGGGGATGGHAGGTPTASVLEGFFGVFLPLPDDDS